MRTLATRTGLLGVVLSVACGCQPADGVTGASEAITNGDAAPDDVAVVGLMHGDEVYCSGTVVGPRFVLTAAHCVATQPPTEVLLVVEGGAPLTITVRSVAIDPDFDLGTLRADLALVELADVAPVTPVPMRTAPIHDADVGTNVRVLGFGRLDAATDPGRMPARRSGWATLAAYTGWNFTITPGPSQTCVGDSGGPTLVSVGGVESVVGVHSFGDAACSSFATDVRVDRFVTEFVRPTMDSHAGDFVTYGPKVIGTACSASGGGTGVWWGALVVAVGIAALRRTRRRERP